MHPVLINLGGFPIYTYGLMLLIAFMLSTSLAVYLGKQRNYPKDYLTDLCMWAILAGIAGCRIGYVVQYPARYLANPLQILNLREGGMTITGGVVLSVLSLFVYFRVKKVPVLNVLDFLAAPLLVGMAWGRLGCLMHGCCFGEICDLPWAITYPATTNLGVGLAAGPRHPSQIYETLMDCGLLAYLLWLLPRQKFAGQSLYTVFAGYGVIRYLDELTRWVDPGTVHGPLNLYQWISIGFFLFGLLGLLGVYGKPPVVIDWIPEGVAGKRPPPEDYRR